MEINRKQWEEFQKFKDEYKEDKGKTNLLLQNINDTIRGGLRSANIKEYRNTYVINAQDSLDASYPMYVHFNIISEMTKIVSIKLSFWLLPYRAYNRILTGTNGYPMLGDPTTINTYPLYGNAYGFPFIDDTTPTEKSVKYTYHRHEASFGIYEENNSPTIGFQISKDNGKTYGSILGQYTADISNLEIKDYITASGSYIIKFTSSARARLSAQVTIKLDIKAR